MTKTDIEIKRLQRRNADLRRELRRERELAAELRREIGQWRGWQPGVWTEVMRTTEVPPSLGALLRAAEVADLLVTLHRDGNVVCVRVGRKP